MILPLNRSHSHGPSNLPVDDNEGLNLWSNVWRLGVFFGHELQHPCHSLAAIGHAGRERERERERGGD